MSSTTWARRSSHGLARRATAAGPGLIAVLVAVAAVVDSLRIPFVSWDTLNVIGTADLALSHLRHGPLLHWGGAFPLIQFIPALPLRAAGLSQDQVVGALIGLNVLSFAALTGLSWASLRGRSKANAILLLAVLLSGTMLWYVHSSFGEPLAAVVTLAAVVACLRHRRHWAAAAFLALAGASKDTAVPFLLVLGVGASVGNPHWEHPAWRWRRVVVLLLAGVLGFLLESAYNYARFGSLLDVPYLDPLLYVPWLQTQISFFAALWVAPNGGLLLFWPSFGVLLGLGAVAARRASAASGGIGARLRSVAPAGAVAAVLLGMTLEVSKFFDPMGWASWGPRLLLPWVPACAYLLVAAYGAELQRLTASILRPAWRFWIAAVALAAVSIPQYVAMMRPSLWMMLTSPDAVCSVPIIQNGVPYFYHCVNHDLWTRGSALLAAYLPGSDPLPLLLGCACAAALVWLLYQLRAASLADDRAGAEEPALSPGRTPA